MDSFFPYLIFAIILIISYLVLVMKRRGDVVNKGPQAPEPPGAWPIIGHLPLLAGSQLLYKALGTIADNYGPIFSVRIGVHPVLVVSSPDVVKELFTTHDKDVSSRPRLVAVKHLGYNFALSGLAPSNAYWREMRKIITLELLSKRNLELLKHIISMEVETSIKELTTLILCSDQAVKKSSTLSSVSDNARMETVSCHDIDVVVDMKEWLEDMTMNMILKMIAGKRYSGSADQRLPEAMNEFARYVAMMVVRDAVPFLGWLDFSGHEKAMKKTAKKLDGILGEWLEEHKKKKKESGDESKTGDEDFMDVLIEVLGGANLAGYGYDADTIIKATSLTLIAGGSTSSSGALIWALCLLLNNRHALLKVKEELDRCVGKERHVTHADISKLLYFQAVVKESLRLYPAGQLLPARQFMDDTTVNGYHVPKDTWLIVNIWKVHRDPTIWANPLDFDPERFLTTHKDFDVRGYDLGLIPFGGGRRSCPGISLALQLVHLALASFLHAFEFRTPDDAPVDMSPAPGLVNNKATPLRLIVSPRLHSHLYA